MDCIKSFREVNKNTQSIFIVFKRFKNLSIDIARKHRYRPVVTYVTFILFLVNRDYLGNFYVIWEKPFFDW